jgi:hypothetical protein
LKKFESIDIELGVLQASIFFTLSKRRNLQTQQISTSAELAKKEQFIHRQRNEARAVLQRS